MRIVDFVTIGVLAGSIGLAALATVPPIVDGDFVQLSVCSKVKSAKDHEELMARLGSLGEIWVRKSIIAAIEDEPGFPDCSELTGLNRAKLLVKGRAGDLVKVLR